MLFLFYYLIIIKNIIIPCVFKNIFHISCPMCGITRSIKALLEGNIMLSLHYNLLGFIVLFFIIFNIIVIIFDIIYNKRKLEYFYNKFGNYYSLIIIVLVLNMIINNIKGI